MRLTTLIATILLAGMVVFLASWFRPQSKSPPPGLPVASALAIPLDEAPTVTVATTRSDTSAPPSLLKSQNQNTPDAQTVENRIAELETLALNDDAASLALILIALSDPLPEIREAALASTIQFGSADAIPALQYVLAKTGESEEKIKIQEAIEFLQLPPLVTSEVKQP